MTIEIRNTLDLLEATEKPKLERVKLSYSLSALAPVMGQGLMQLHYDKLYKGYVDRYNKGEGDKNFNEAGAYLHGIFFSQFKRPGLIKPVGRIDEIINLRHKNFIDFKEHFKEEALELTGSGWVYLSKSGDIKVIRNHAIRKDIAIIVDLWEHAWTGTYGTNKGKYIDNIWRIMDWHAINHRLATT
ncbi:MAG TPA: Fe-Mn family superoxide dismutase [Methanosarcina sp.]|nr:Fe-Mn family superoxide dismutase [Methanosarcina sp.]